MNTALTAVAEFGDVIWVRDDQGVAELLDAPPLTRIDLVFLTDPSVPITVTGEGICLAGQVWYQPIDLTPNGLTLICRRTRDTRPPVAQAKTDRTRVRA